MTARCRQCLRTALSTPTFWRVARAWTLGFATLAAASGCVHLRRRGPVAQDVIIARQLSQQGMDALHKGSVDRAEERFVKAIEHCPTNTTARYQLANCLWQRGERQQAIQQLDTAIKMASSEDVDMTVELGYMWANIGRFDEAMKMAEQSIRVAPELPIAWQLQGDVLREQRSWTEALASYHRSLTYDPNNADVLLSVSEVYHQLDRPARVLATLHQLDDQLPRERQPERMLVLRSLAFQQLDRHDEAVQVLVKANRDRRLSHGATIQLAQAQVAAGQYGEAQETIKRALPQADASEQASFRQLLANMAEQRVRATGTSLR